LKIVGRGRAVQVTKELVDSIKKRMPFVYFQVRYTQALNKIGEVVDEIHVMVNVKENLRTNNNRNGNNNI
jgi:hypothetical protein